MSIWKCGDIEMSNNKFDNQLHFDLFSLFVLTMFHYPNTFSQGAYEMQMLYGNKTLFDLFLLEVEPEKYERYVDDIDLLTGWKPLMNLVSMGDKPCSILKNKILITVVKE
jgi:hypothetical protein